MKAPWEKLDGETPASFAKFRTFLKIDPTHRTVSHCAELCGVKERGLQTLATRHNWIERATAYDEYHQKNAIAPTFNRRLEQQKAYLEASRGIGSSLLRMGLNALKEIEQSEGPLPAGVAVRAIEVGHRLYGHGVGADQPKSDVENAIAILADGGYLPDELVEKLMENIGEMREKNKAVFTQQTEKTILLEPADDELK